MAYQDVSKCYYNVFVNYILMVDEKIVVCMCKSDKNNEYAYIQVLLFSLYIIRYEEEFWSWTKVIFELLVEISILICLPV